MAKMDWVSSLYLAANILAPIAILITVTLHKRAHTKRFKTTTLGSGLFAIYLLFIFSQFILGQLRF